MGYLGVKELHRANKCMASPITGLEQSILVQISDDKSKHISLADELKRDIPTWDVKFAVRKYKPSALIIEYLSSRAGSKAGSPFSFVHLR